MATGIPKTNQFAANRQFGRTGLEFSSPYRAAVMPFDSSTGLEAQSGLSRLKGPPPRRGSL